MTDGVHGVADPSRSASSAQHLVGRRAELALLSRAMEGVDAGGRTAVVLVGEAGIGKSRLLEFQLAQWRAEGRAVLAGRCLDVAATTAFQPVLDALGMHHLAGPETRRDGFELSDLFAMVRELAGDRPLVLALDDIQWADSATLDLMLYLLAGVHDLPLLVLATVRPEAAEDAGPVRQLVANLGRLPFVTMVELGRLSRAETTELARTASSRPLDDDDLATIWTRSGGNAFAVEQFASSSSKDRVPSTLTKAVLTRIEAVGPDALVLMRALACGAPPVPDGVLREVSGLSESQYLAAQGALLSRRLVAVDRSGVSPAHQLIADAVRESTLPYELTVLHRRFVTAFGSAGAAPGAVAHHKLALGLVDEAVADLRSAALLADAAHDYADAWAHWSAAASTVAPGADEARALTSSAVRAGALCGEHAKAMSLLERVLQARPRQPWALLLRGDLLSDVGRASEALEQYQLAETITDDPAEVAKAKAKAADVLAHLGRHRKAKEQAEWVLSHPSRGSRELAATVRAVAQVQLDEPDGVTTLRERWAFAHRSGHPVKVADASLRLATILTGPLNELREGIELALTAAGAADSSGLTRTYGIRLRICASEGMFRAGRWEDAETQLATVLAAEPSGTALILAILARARLCVGRGRLDEARADLDRARTLNAGRSDRRFLIPMLTLESGLAMWHGEHAEALDAALAALSVEGTDDMWLLAPVVWHAFRAAAEARANGRRFDAGTESRLTDLDTAFSRRDHVAHGPVHDAMVAYQALWRAEAVRHSPREAVRAWARAEELWHRRGQPYPTLYARVRGVEAALALNRRSARARRTLRESLDDARSLGAGPLVNEIVGLARRARLEVESPDARSPDAVATAVPERDPLATLTAREREVLRLVADGCRDREIAAKLFLSPRTVSTHVSHILRQLDVSSRLQAATVYLAAERSHPQDTGGGAGHTAQGT